VCVCVCVCVLKLLMQISAVYEIVKVGCERLKPNISK
jgi:hypothetical protein